MRSENFCIGGILVVSSFILSNAFWKYSNLSTPSITTHQENSNNYAIVNFCDGTKVPMIQLPDGSYTNLAGFYNARREKFSNYTERDTEKVSAEERDITKKLVGGEK